MNKRGFTLIELLAVIIILGILMIIAIPSVTKYISDSRKSTYIGTAKELISSARNMVNEGKLEMFDTDTTYYIDVSCIKTENGTRSPYGDFVKAYVVVIYDGTGYDYYWTSVDEVGNGIKKIVNVDKLSEDEIQSDLKIEDIANSAGINGRSKYMLIDKNNTNCGKGISKTTSTYIDENNGTQISIIYPTGKDKSSVVTGDIVIIGTEHFYVIRHDGNNLVLLSKYNLKVGNNYSFVSGSVEKIGEYKSSDPGYGIQSEETKVNPQWDNNTYYGAVSFSSTNYWNGNVGNNLKYYGSYSESNYPYVYDSNSYLYSYIQNYAKYLGSFVKDARLLKYEEALYLGCGTITSQSCVNSKQFLTETNFWLGNAYNNKNLMFIASNKNFNNTSYYYLYNFGVRPVIVI